MIQPARMGAKTTRAAEEESADRVALPQQCSCCCCFTTVLLRAAAAARRFEESYVASRRSTSCWRSAAGQTTPWLRTLHVKRAAAHCCSQQNLKTGSDCCLSALWSEPYHLYDIYILIQHLETNHCIHIKIPQPSLLAFAPGQRFDLDHRSAWRRGVCRSLPKTAPSATRVDRAWRSTPSTARPRAPRCCRATTWRSARCTRRRASRGAARRRAGTAPPLTLLPRARRPSSRAPRSAPPTRRSRRRSSASSSTASAR